MFTQNIKHFFWVTLLLILPLVGCDQSEPSSNTTEVLKQSNTNEYQPVVKGYELSFPRDHNSHPAFKSEWWYFTANLETDAGKQIAVQWTLFRIATGLEQSKAIGWKKPQIYMAHAVITTDEKVWKAERFSRGGIGQAGVLRKPYRAWLDNWSWRSLGQDPFPGLLEFEDGDMSARLDINNVGSIVLQGENGYSKKHATNDIASYYYSAPFLDINGSITLDDIQYNVTGKGWYDREWSSSMLSKSQQGWDWFSIQLDDGSALMISQVREKNALPFYFGSRSWPDGRVVQLGTSDIRLTPIIYTSVEGKNVPLNWRLDVRSQDLKLKVEAVRKEQWLPFVFPYWEGPIKVVGSHSGQGFMELTGY
ncbi:lipocalin-like domain-containing protein [Photobacterium indicum]|uniref:lipocalin-like domain-containing protein n=1 Tax=Photobacterium indicum TaxID=81447 RepID=UPI003D129CC5